MDIFTLFANTPYTFLVIDQTVAGNTVSATFEAEGIFKLRAGMVQVDNVEQVAGDATLHIKPDETYLALLDDDLMGHGVSIGKHSTVDQQYRIIGVTEGFDYDKGKLEFYRLVLKREDIVSWQEPPTVLQ